MMSYIFYSLHNIKSGMNIGFYQKVLRIYKSKFFDNEFNY